MAAESVSKKVSKRKSNKPFWRCSNQWKMQHWMDQK